MSLTKTAHDPQVPWASPAIFFPGQRLSGPSLWANSHISPVRSLGYDDDMARRDEVRPEWLMMGKRIVAAREALDPPLNMSELARAIGSPPANLSRFEKGKRPLTKQWAEKISRVVGVSAAFLMFGNEAAQSEISDYNGNGDKSVTLSQRSYASARLPVTYVQLRGEAQAGLWLSEDVAHHVPDPVPVGPLPEYEPQEQFAYQVSGQSMNLEGITDGAFVICVPPAELVNNDIVIVERHRDGQVERSCKMYRREGGFIKLVPRSTDPRFKDPIVYEERGGSEDDHTRVQIVGRVIGWTTLRQRRR